MLRFEYDLKAVGPLYIYYKEFKRKLTLICLPNCQFYLRGAIGQSSPGKACEIFVSNTTTVASFTKEVNLWLAKCPLKTNGHLANRGLTSLVKEATVFYQHGHEHEIPPGSNSLPITSFTMKGITCGEIRNFNLIKFWLQSSICGVPPVGGWEGMGVPCALRGACVTGCYVV